MQATNDIIYSLLWFLRSIYLKDKTAILQVYFRNKMPALVFQSHFILEVARRMKRQAAIAVLVVVFTTAGSVTFKIV